MILSPGTSYKYMMIFLLDWYRNFKTMGYPSPSIDNKDPLAISVI